MRSVKYFRGVLDWMIIFQWFIDCLLQNVVGGRQCKRPVKAFEMYDADTRSWTSLPMLSCKRSYGGVLWDRAGRLCLLGGLRQGGAHQTSKFTNNVNIFDCTRGTDDRKSNQKVSQTVARGVVLSRFWILLDLTARFDFTWKKMQYYVSRACTCHDSVSIRLQ